MRYRYRSEDEMKDSWVWWIGKIPKHWNTIKGKYIFENNKIKNSGKFENILSLTLNGVIDRDRNNFEGLQPGSFDGYQEFKEDNLVFKLIDLENENTSRVGYVHKEGLMSPAYIRLSKKLDDNVKFYYYNYFDYYNQRIYNFLGSVGVRSALNSTDLLEMNVISNSNIEQYKIANFLDEKTAQFDSIISKKETLIQRLEEAKKSLISEVVTGKVKVVKTSNGYELVERKKEEMKDSGVKFIGGVPIDWEITKIKWKLKTESGATPNSENQKEYYNGNIKWIRSTDLNNEEVSDSEIKITEKALEKFSCRILPIDSVLIAMYGGAGTIGKNGILKTPAAINQAVCAILPCANIISKFLHYFIMFYRPFWMIDANGTRKDPNINQEVIRNLNVCLPSENEQQVIVQYLNYKHIEINKVLECIQKQIEKLKQAKQSLISEAVTGKIEILD